ncbi:MAG: hypothetical protein NWF00_12855 [Candidatus Bathyarchaeota archaeon]|nr:hypothetical protein [Candidatus Bathyarchaeota archaeon]
MNTHNFVEDIAIPALGKLPTVVQKIYLVYFAPELLLLATIFGY